MEPHNEIVTPGEVTLEGEAWRTNFALARRGKVYLIYSLHGGSGTATLEPGQYSAARVDPRDGTRTELGTVAGGTVHFSLPPGDWVLIYTGLRKSWLRENKNQSVLACTGSPPPELVAGASRVARRFWR